MDDTKPEPLPHITNVQDPSLVTKTNLLSCIDCGRGGHTRNVLFAIWTDIPNRLKGYACNLHVDNHYRLKDLRL